MEQLIITYKTWLPLAKNINYAHRILLPLPFYLQEMNVLDCSLVARGMDCQLFFEPSGHLVVRLREPEKYLRALPKEHLVHFIRASPGYEALVTQLQALQKPTAVPDLEMLTHTFSATLKLPWAPFGMKFTPLDFADLARLLSPKDQLHIEQNMLYVSWSAIGPAPVPTPPPSLPPTSVA